MNSYYNKLKKICLIQLKNWRKLLLVLSLLCFVFIDAGICNSKITVDNCINNNDFPVSDKEKEGINFFLLNKTYEFPPVQVAPSSENIFSTPMSWFNGHLYVVDIEPPDGDNNGVNLKTVVRKGSLGNDGIWQWQSNVIETRTIEDPYHTQASIAVDKRGFVHIAYNMHNMPWQYKVSEFPEDISKFVFRGELLTYGMLSMVKHKNKTPFPYIGRGAIPGNQITYPAFFVDRNKELYITYRFATRPNRVWKKRGFAGGVAKYDAEKQEWKAIGGKLDIKKSDAIIPVDSKQKSYHVAPFAYDDNWIVYLIRLHFDKNNVMHVSWTWREGGAGRDCVYPSYASSNDPKLLKFINSNRLPYHLPIDLSMADIISKNHLNEKIYAKSSISADPSGIPYIIYSPIGSSRVLVHFDRSKQGWSEPERTPMSASEIYIDDTGNQWVFASGINVFKRKANESDWRNVYSGKGYVRPKIQYVEELKGFFIHSFSTNYKQSRITWHSAR